jgi:hypothetical protein
VIRSRSRRLAITCWLSVIWPYFPTRVRRRLRPSVVVDVAMDVGRGSRRCRIPICSRAPDSWSGVSPTGLLAWAGPPMILHAGGRVASRRPGAARPHASSGAALDETAAWRCLALPPGWRVVALREVGGMPHLAYPGPATAALATGHPGDLPARRGHGLAGQHDAG